MRRRQVRRAKATGERAVKRVLLDKAPIQQDLVDAAPRARALLEARPEVGLRNAAVGQEFKSPGQRDARRRRRRARNGPRVRHRNSMMKKKMLCEARLVQPQAFVKSKQRKR